MKDQHVIVVGAGAWGTALSLAMVRKEDRQVTLIAQTVDHAKELETYRENKTYLPGVALDSRLNIQHEGSALEKADVILWVIPAQYTQRSLKALSSHIPASSPFVICSKGIDCTGEIVNSESFLYRIVSKIIPNTLAILSGPNFAAEVAVGLPAAATLAALPFSFAKDLAILLDSPSFSLIPHDDVVGVQVVGALKNVMAIGSGLLLGCQLGQNAQASLLGHGFQEMKALATAMGGQVESFFTLAGIGDFILTCTSTRSRNTSLGVALGQGQSLQKILAEPGGVCEGVATAKAVYSLSQYYQIEMPVFETIYRILRQDLSVSEGVRLLLRLPR